MHSAVSQMDLTGCSSHVFIVVNDDINVLGYGARYGTLLLLSICLRW